ncbi:hypothetical protein GCM10010306_087470 [Streptomyces umbrinus]|nr:hypothetical protein GCM10010306_087470 [Streptomyces umbrinus]
MSDVVAREVRSLLNQETAAELASVFRGLRRLGPKSRRLEGYLRGSEVLVIGSGWCAPAT